MFDERYLSPFGDSGQRLIRFGKLLHPNDTLVIAAQLLAENEGQLVLINGFPAASDEKIRRGDTITLAVSSLSETMLRAIEEDIRFQILSIARHGGEDGRNLSGLLAQVIEWDNELKNRIWATYYTARDALYQEKTKGKKRIGRLIEDSHIQRTASGNLKRYEERGFFALTADDITDLLRSIVTSIVENG